MTRNKPSIINGRTMRYVKAAYGPDTIRVIADRRLDGLTLRQAVAELATDLRWFRRLILPLFKEVRNAND